MEQDYVISPKRKLTGSFYSSLHFKMTIVFQTLNIFSPLRLGSSNQTRASVHHCLNVLLFEIIKELFPYEGLDLIKCSLCEVYTICTLVI
jgi:hypothetical protein